MINRIYPKTFSTAVSRFADTKNTSNSIAYRLEDSRWSEKFGLDDEKEFISNLLEKAKNSLLKYVGPKGLGHEFATENGGKILYTKESKGMMSNLKYIPSSNDEKGFYIINNQNTEAARSYKTLSNILDININKNRSHSQGQIMYMKSDQTHVLKKNRMLEQQQEERKILQQYEDLFASYRQSHTTTSNVNQVRGRSFPTPNWTSNSRQAQTRHNSWVG